MMTPTSSPDFATLVPETRRSMFLPVMFGRKLLMVGENAVYTFMERLSPRDYRGGFWNFYEQGGRPLFMAPTSKPRYRIEGNITTYTGEVSAEAAGIIATMFAFSHLSFQYDCDRLPQGYDRLYAYMADHPEMSAIHQTID